MSKQKNPPDAKQPEETKPTPEEIAQAEADEKARAEADKANDPPSPPEGIHLRNMADLEAATRETIDGGTTNVNGKTCRMILDSRGVYLYTAPEFERELPRRDVGGRFKMPM